jgi:hypothetical protein
LRCRSSASRRNCLHIPTFRVVACRHRRPSCARTMRRVRHTQESKCHGRFKRGLSHRAGTASLRAYQPLVRDLQKPISSGRGIWIRTRLEYSAPLPTRGGTNGAVDLGTWRATSRGGTPDAAEASQITTTRATLPSSQAPAMDRRSQTGTWGREALDRSPPRATPRCDAVAQKSVMKMTACAPRLGSELLPNSLPDQKHSRPMQSPVEKRRRAKWRIGGVAARRSIRNIQIGRPRPAMPAEVRAVHGWGCTAACGQSSVLN